jgi:glutaredoxin
VKRFLAARGFEFEERDVRSGFSVARELVETYKSRSTPTVVVGDEVLIGFQPERIEQLLAT